ncbi:MAG: zinc-binding alcohol dehydrogenase family protein [Roseovarius sp.]|nr:zinc-binding alcohol dehydrogenase family protein [Roseovarius sp.]MCY4207515.1 zinc-binding alcohol dehydrogenase family protein [Roseovarius sp.]MCY4317330.1 zinc-binding alcohol dehydrogenase family protein [Roseovarius sp.]
MKALGYSQRGPISNPNAVVEFDAETPSPDPRDLLVEVKGVSVNPVDVKVRANRPPEGTRILGFDAAGVVKEVGAEVTMFKPGDEVFYAGEFTRPGSNAEFQAVDERLVGPKPSSLSMAHAAGMPLTSITAWELLFDSFGLKEGDGDGEAILIIGGAGGVGSILMQFARKLTGLTVVATASRDDTVAWTKKMGADHVVNHRNPLNEEMKALGIAPKYVAALTGTEGHWDAIIDMIKPRGHIGMIDDPSEINWQALKLKALSFSWEFMFARSMFRANDMDAQGKLLTRVSEMLDSGDLLATVNKHCGAMSEASLREALAHQEEGSAIGKTVLGGFEG